MRHAPIIWPKFLLLQASYSQVLIQNVGASRDQVLEIDMESAWLDFSPASSWGVGKGSGGNMVSGWEDVGGMHDVRDALREALELPTKYSKLLARYTCLTRRIPNEDTLVCQS